MDYGQLYIFDSSEATKKRMENNQGCLQTVMAKLGNFLKNTNPFADSHLQMQRFIQYNPSDNYKDGFHED